MCQGSSSQWSQIRVNFCQFLSDVETVRRIFFVGNKGGATFASHGNICSFTVHGRIFEDICLISCIYIPKTIEYTEKFVLAPGGGFSSPLPHPKREICNI